MTHADSSLVPTDISTKDEFYEFLQEQLASLIEDTRSWVSNLAQISSLLYHAYLTSPLYGLHKDKAYSPVVNWVGFYVQDLSPGASPDSPLGLGPFHGRPACMQIRIQAGKGVCADAYIKGEAVVVSDVDQYPGHLACDGDSKSEIVLPLSIPSGDGSLRKVGVFDLDATVVGTYDDADRRGLQGLLDIVVKGSDWP